MIQGIETSNAIIYGLLAQEAPLTREETKSLQTQLISQGIDTGAPDGLMGKNTAGAIGEFLRSPEHRAFVGQVSDGIRKNLDGYGQKELIDRIEHQNELPNVHLHNAEALDVLDKGSLSKDNISQLQESLNNLGHDTGGTNGSFGPKTSEAITDFLGDNIGALSTIAPSILLETMKNGQTGELKELMNRPELNHLVDQRISDALSNIGDLETTMDHGAVYDLQTLLTLGGYAPGGIDGISGNNTLSSVDRYTASQNPDAVIPNQKPEVVKPTTQEFNRTVDTLPSRGLLSNGEYTHPINGDNGYGVANLDIEKAWAKVTATTVDDGIISHDGTQTSSLASNPRPLVVIDLGHGSDFSKDGKGNDIIDPGAVSKFENGLTEVDVVDPVGQALANDLREQGFDVAFVRNIDEQLRLEGTHSDTLKVRSDFANQLGIETGANGVLMVSLHANSFGKESAHGSRIYHDVDGANSINSNSVSLTENIANAYSIDDGTSAVKHVGDLTVLDHFENFSSAPSSAATLIELGFLSNEDDARKLKEMSENPEIAAKQIAEGINNHVLKTTPELSNNTRNISEQSLELQ